MRTACSIGVSAAIGEEDPVELTRGAFGDQPRGFGAGVVGVLWCHRAQLCGLFGNGGNDFRVLVADIGVHQL